MDGGPDDAMTRQRSTHIDVLESLDRGKTFKAKREERLAQREWKKETTYKTDTEKPRERKN